MDAHLRSELEQIFGAYVRQGTLESAAGEMAENGRAHPELAASYATTLAAGIKAAKAGDITICEAVEKSGYRAPTADEAEALITDLRRLYYIEMERP